MNKNAHGNEGLTLEAAAEVMIVAQRLRIQRRGTIVTKRKESDYKTEPRSRLEGIVELD